MGRVRVAAFGGLWHGKRWMMGKNISLTWLMRQLNTWHNLREVTAALHRLHLINIDQCNN
jgi:hypothetical protein